MVDVGAGEQTRHWEFVAAPPHSAPGVVSMVGYRALDVPDVVHRGLPSALLTFIVSLDEGVEGAACAAALATARPVPVLLGGLHVEASQVRQRRGQAGVQLAVHPLAARALFGVPSVELSVTDFDATVVLGRQAVELRDRVSEARGWREAFSLVTGTLVRPTGAGATRRCAPIWRTPGTCWNAAGAACRWGWWPTGWG